MVLGLEHRPPFVLLLCDVQMLASNLLQLQPFRFKFNQRRGSKHPTASNRNLNIFSAWVTSGHVPTPEPITVGISYFGSQTPPPIGLTTVAHPLYSD